MAPDTTPNTMPIPRPSRIAAIEPLGLNSESTTPTNRPSQAPDAAPVASTRPQVRRPITRSTSMRSTPTMVTSATGKSLSARWSTTRCASSYFAYDPTGHPDGGSGRLGNPGAAPGRFPKNGALTTFLRWLSGPQCEVQASCQRSAPDESAHARCVLPRAWAERRQGLDVRKVP